MSEKEQRLKYIKESDNRVSNWMKARRDAFYNAIHRLNGTKPEELKQEEKPKKIYTCLDCDIVLEPEYTYCICSSCIDNLKKFNPEFHRQETIEFMKSIGWEYEYSLKYFYYTKIIDKMSISICDDFTLSAYDSEDDSEINIKHMKSLVSMLVVAEAVLFSKFGKFDKC